MYNLCSHYLLVLLISTLLPQHSHTDAKMWFPSRLLLLLPSELVCYQECQRGFLTLPIFWCIWRQSPLRTFVLLLQRNTIGRFYTVDTVLKGLRPTLLTALCQCPKTNYKGLTDKASSFLIFRQANRICIRFYFRKICLHTTLKNRAFVP